MGMEPAAARPEGQAPATPTGEPPAATDAHGRPKRYVRNYLLDTGLQLRLASYLLAVAVALSVGLGWLLWSAYRETSRVIALGDPDVGESIAQALAREDRWRMFLIAAALSAVLLTLLLASVVITHRIAGPAFVIARTCRAVADGSLARPRPATRSPRRSRTRIAGGSSSSPRRSWRCSCASSRRRWSSRTASPGRRS